MNKDEIYQKIRMLLHPNCRGNYSLKDCIQSLRDISKKLGPEKTGDLISSIFNFSLYYPDEIIEVLNIIKEFDIKRYKDSEMTTFLENYGTIFTKDSFEIRNAAIETFCVLATNVTNKKVVFNTIYKFACSANVNVRRASCAICKVYNDSSDINVQYELFQCIKHLHSDKNALVRKEVLCFLIKVIPAFTQDQIGEIEDILTEIAKDKSLIVSMYLPQAFAKLVEVNATANVIDLCKSLIKSADWKVVVLLMDKIDQILVNSNDSDVLFSLIEQTTSSAVYDVCVSGIKAIPPYIILSADGVKADGIMNIISRLLDSGCDEILEVIAEILPSLSKKESLNQFALDTLENLVLLDKDNVTSSIIKHSNVIDYKYALDLLSRGAEFEEWRKRLSMTQLLAPLSKIVKNTESEKLFSKLLIKFLFDDAIGVRSVVINSLNEVIENLGKEWACKELVFQIKDRFLSTAFYQERQTAVIAIIRSEIYNLEACNEIVNKILEKAIHDPVSNVRYICASLLPIESQLLKPLYEDPDEDVREIIIKRNYI